jgi:hypothetical protein
MMVSSNRGARRERGGDEVSDTATSVGPSLSCHIGHDWSAAYIRALDVSF